MMAMPCLAQEQPRQDDAGSLEHIQPYEVALNDLVSTPWDVSRFNSQWISSCDQNLAPLSITLEQGQDLIIHIDDVEGFRCLDSSCLEKDRYHSTGLVWDHIDSNTWGGWTHFIKREAPLNEGKIEVSGGASYQHNNGTSVSYHFKNHHSGKSTLTFYYCIFGDEKTWRSQFNVKEITITCK